LLQPQCDNVTECTAPLSEFPIARTSWIDYSMNSEGATPKVKNGVKIGEGDGTVSLLSLGSMCVEGWKRKRWNPGNIKITTVEVSLYVNGLARAPDTLPTRWPMNLKPIT